MNTASPRITDLNGTSFSRLEHQAVVRLDAPGRLQVLRGRAWVTVNGQPRDWFLVAGRTMELRERQQLIVQADPQCVIGWRASGQQPARRQWLAEHLARVGARLRAALWSRGSLASS